MAREITVGQLIEKLSRLDPNAGVVVAAQDAEDRVGLYSLSDLICSNGDAVQLNTVEFADRLERPENLGLGPDPL